MGMSRNDAEKIKMNVCTGAGAATNITLTGIAAGDTIIGVVNLTDAAAVSLAGLAISANAFQVTASTSGKALLVLWIDKSAG